VHLSETCQARTIRDALTYRSMYVQFPHADYTADVQDTHLRTYLSFDEYVSTIRQQASQRVPEGEATWGRKVKGVYKKRRHNGEVYAFEARYTKKKTLKVHLCSARFGALFICQPVACSIVEIAVTV
jgi:hypothetical protein